MMNYNLLISVTFLSLFLLSSLMVILCSNPIYSLLSLILCFFNASSSLFLLEIDFIPVSFIVVYVGAVAVLFLFVIMMLNIKASELTGFCSNFMPFVVFVAMSYFLLLFLSNSFENSTFLVASNSFYVFFSDFFASSTDTIDYIALQSKNSNVFSIGIALFSSFSYQFIISSFVLLVAMLGTIALTLSKTFTVKTQSVYLQVLTDYRTAISTYQ
jgi:NADH:ubiquinone oxidoreductase subunit 6 (subunit J)